MEFASFKTKNCIVTGKPATLFTGHVLMETLDRNGRSVVVSILAGFADSKIYESAVCGKAGCYGEWKPTFGAKLDVEAEVANANGSN